MTAPESAVVRPATESDAIAIAACHLACWRETYRGLLSSGFLAAWNESAKTQMWQRTLADPDADVRIVVGEIGSGTIGFAGAGPSHDEQPDRDTELYALYVRQFLHGTGVGQRLFNAAVGERPCSLWVAERNPRAIAFYRRQGFRPDGARRVSAEWENLATIRLVR